MQFSDTLLPDSWQSLPGAEVDLGKNTAVASLLLSGTATEVNAGPILRVHSPATLAVTGGARVGVAAPAAGAESEGELALENGALEAAFLILGEGELSVGGWLLNSAHGVIGGAVSVGTDDGFGYIDANESLIEVGSMAFGATGPHSYGTLTTSDTELRVAGSLVFGLDGSGDGSLSGAKFSATDLQVGVNPDSDGQVSCYLLSGLLTGYLEVGVAGNGELLLESAALTCANLLVALAPGSSGTVLADLSSNITLAGVLAAGGSASTPGGTAFVGVRNGAVLAAADAVIIHAGATVRVAGGVTIIIIVTDK